MSCLVGVMLLLVGCSTPPAAPVEPAPTAAAPAPSEGTPSAGTPSAGTPSSRTPSGPILDPKTKECLAKIDAAEGELAKGGACKADADCTLVGSPRFTGGVEATDVATAKRLEPLFESLNDCPRPDVTMSAPPPAACRDGRCVVPNDR